MASLVKSSKHVRKKYYQFIQTLPENWKEKNTSQFVLGSQNYHNTKDVTRNENYRAIFFMNTESFCFKSKKYFFALATTCLIYCCHFYSLRSPGLIPHIFCKQIQHFMISVVVIILQVTQLNLALYDFC